MLKSILYTLIYQAEAFITRTQSIIWCGGKNEKFHPVKLLSPGFHQLSHLWQQRPVSPQPLLTLEPEWWCDVFNGLLCFKCSVMSCKGPMKRKKVQTFSVSTRLCYITLFNCCLLLFRLKVCLMEKTWFYFYPPYCCLRVFNRTLHHMKRVWRTSSLPPRAKMNPAEISETRRPVIKMRQQIQSEPQN